MKASTMPPSDESPKSRRRRWLQYSFRSVAIAVSVLAVWLAIVTHRAREQARIVAAIEAVGGSVRYDYQRRGGAEASPPGPRWLRAWLGDKYFRTPLGVELDQKPADDALLESICGLTELDSLSLAGSDVTDAGLVHVRRLRKLRSLDLAFTQVTDRGIAQLGPLPELVAIRLDATAISDEALRSLSQYKLYSATLSHTQITDVGLAVLGRITSLGDLDISQTPTTDEGLRFLAWLPALTRLRLDDFGYYPDRPPRITDTGLAHVARISTLRDLGLSGHGMTDAGLAKLAALKRLQVLTLYHPDPKFTPEGVEKLKAAPPTLTNVER